jgi:hypothetical protein
VPVLAGCDAAQQAQDIGQGVDKAAGEALRDRVRKLADAAGNADAADAQQALADVEAAARRLAGACDVNVDQVGG